MDDAGGYASTNMSFGGECDGGPDDTAGVSI
jgi:hypothetical protein